VIALRHPGAGAALRGDPRSAADASEREEYRRFLDSRWAPRSVLLGLYAAGGTLVFFGFDWAFTRSLPAPPGVLEIAACRLPWVALPVVGCIAALLRPGWRGLPACVIAFSVAFTWANDWAYDRLGLAGSTVQALALVISVVTAATFLPVTLPGRLGVLALQTLGHAGLEWWWPQGRPAVERLWTQGAVLCLVLCVTVVFENVAAAQRRGLRLRRQLERSVSEVEESRHRTASAAAHLQELASTVAHQVNNPLAAVKVNVGYLRDAADPAERREVAEETLVAVDRIARIVAELQRKAVDDERA